MVRANVINAKIDKKNKTVEFENDADYHNNNPDSDEINPQMLRLVRQLEKQNGKIATLMTQVDAVNAKIKDSDEFLQIEAQNQLAQESQNDDPDSDSKHAM